MFGDFLSIGLIRSHCGHWELLPVMKGGGEGKLRAARASRETVSLQKINLWCHGSEAYFETLVICLIRILSILRVRSLNGPCKLHIVS